MKFDLKVLPKMTHEDIEFEKIVTKMELTIERNDFMAEFEEDEIATVVTIREMFFMFHLPYGYTAQIADENCYRIYEELKAHPEFLSFTVHAEEVEQLNCTDYRKRGRNVNFDFTFNTEFKQEYSNILE